VSTWRDWPQRLHDATGLPVVVYSRRGYGRSQTITLPRPLDYMQREGEAFNATLADLAIEGDVILVGHSDGASIAIVAAASSSRVVGLALLAPHVFVEDVSVASIAKAKREYDAPGSPLRARLARHHDDVDVAFRGWNDAWLDPAFRTSFDLRAYLPKIRVPVVVVQGRDDEYGTLAQVDAIAGGVAGPCRSLVHNDCGHAPQRDKPDETTAAVAALVALVALVASAISK
jgi:pimeloyl-ACP methyl ester carboxylesterase